MNGNHKEHVTELGPIQVLKNQRRVLINNQELSLPDREFTILALLVQNYHKDEDCVGYMEFANVVLEWPKTTWGKVDRSDQESIRRSFITYKNNLTRKLEPFNLELEIESIPKKGYRFAKPDTDGTERLGSGQQAPDAMLSYDDSSIDFYLNLKEEDGAARFPLSANTQEWMIGRHPIECNVLVNHQRVSGIHALIFQQDGQWFICDIGTHRTGSAHGTFIHSREKRYQVGTGKENSMLLQSGDRIEIAPYLFYRFEEYSLP